MRLHNVLDELKKTWISVDNRASYRDDEYFRTILDNCPKHIHFDFGSIAPIPDDEWKDMQSYSYELAKHDLFDVPYEYVTFCWSNAEPNGEIVERIVCCHRIHIDGLRKGPAMLDLWIFIKFKTPNGYTYLPIHLIMGINAGGKIGFMKPEPMFAFDATGKRESLPEEIKTLAIREAQDFLALVVMLHADGVVLNTTPAPEALNKARAKKGKLPIGTIHEVRIKVGNKTVTAADMGGTHASPRLHMRRGHVRRLPGGKITNVRPCIVGAVSGGNVPIPSYSVGRHG